MSKKSKTSKMKQLEKDVAKIKRDYKPETKVNPTLVNVVINVAGSIFNVNLMAQGAGANQRVGLKILNKRLIANVELLKTAGNTDTCDTVRLIWFRDKAHNGVAPAVQDVLLAVDPLEMYNFDLRKRIEIISDRIVTLGDLANNNGDMCHTSRYDFKLNKPVYYSGAAANELSLEKGPVYLLAVASPVAVAGTEPTIRVRAQLQFTDA